MLFNIYIIPWEKFCLKGSSSVHFGCKIQSKQTNKKGSWYAIKTFHWGLNLILLGFYVGAQCFLNSACDFAWVLTSRAQKELQNYLKMYNFFLYPSIFTYLCSSCKWIIPLISVSLLVWVGSTHNLVYKKLRKQNKKCVYL